MYVDNWIVTQIKANLLSKGSLSTQASYKAQSNNRITETENKCSDQAEKLSVLLH